VTKNILMLFYLTFFLETNEESIEVSVANWSFTKVEIWLFTAISLAPRERPAFGTTIPTKQRALLVMCWLWPKARKPESQARIRPGQAKLWSLAFSSFGLA
jgi:hypothetical protein